MKHTHVFQRRERIVQLLRQRDEMTVEQLARHMGISGWTVRRDLAALEDTGQIARHHGGAALTSSARAFAQHETKAQLQSAAKIAIGRAAAQLITSGQVVALAAGTTTDCVALGLRGREGLAIMTNSLTIAQELSREAGIRVTCTGGEVHGDYYTLTGPVTERVLSAHYYDVAVVGVSAITLENGLGVDSAANAASIGIMLRNARRRIVVADHTKFDKPIVIPLAPLADVNLIVTDTAPPARYRQHLERIGTTLMVVSAQ